MRRYSGAKRGEMSGYRITMDCDHPGHAGHLRDSTGKALADIHPFGMDGMKALLAERDNLLDLLRRVEWAAYNPDHPWDQCCPVCGRLKRDGHAPDCELAAALKGGE
jgi:hypothetical protein